MKKKLKNLAGFTLAELLIVVAIIGVLVAISIPIFTSRLEASRESTDAANLRSAYAAATTALLTGKSDDTAPPANTKVGDTDYQNFVYTTGGKLILASHAGDGSDKQGKAMLGKSTQSGFQGADIDDLPAGVTFSGWSHNGALTVTIIKAATGDTIAVQFAGDTAVAATPTPTP